MRGFRGTEHGDFFFCLWVCRTVCGVIDMFVKLDYKTLASIFLLLSLSSSFGTAVGDSPKETSEKLTILTEQYPPFNYKDEAGALKGSVTDIVTEIQKRVGNTDPIKLVSWSRGYSLTTKEGNKNYLLFSISRTKAREKLFKWVGPVLESTQTLFALKSSNIKISNVEEAKKYRVGAVIKDVGEQILKQKGFKQIDSVYDGEQNVKKLIRGRVDLIVGGKDQIPQTISSALEKIKEQKLQRKPEDFVPVFDVHTAKVYIAFSVATSDEIVNKWQKAFDEIKKEGLLKKILKKYSK